MAPLAFPLHEYGFFLTASPPIRWLVNLVISELYGFSSCCCVHKQAFQLTPSSHALCVSVFSEGGI